MMKKGFSNGRHPSNSTIAFGSRLPKDPGPASEPSSFSFKKKSLALPKSPSQRLDGSQSKLAEPEIKSLHALRGPTTLTSQTKSSQLKKVQRPHDESLQALASGERTQQKHQRDAKVLQEERLINLSLLKKKAQQHSERHISYYSSTVTRSNPRQMICRT